MNFQMQVQEAGVSPNATQQNALLQISVSYLLWVFRGHKIIEDLQIVIRRPLLKNLLFFWNFGLAIQSIVAFLLAWPHLSDFFQKKGLSAICNASWNGGPMSAIAATFAWSKIAELGDTIFLVLSFKEVPFLHWYHHLTVMWYTFSSHWLQASTGIVFVMMNLAVHSWMYLYQALKSLGFQVPGSKALTLVQILQMFVGLFVNVYAMTQSNCETSPEMILAGLFMYASQALLFLNQAQRRQVLHETHSI